MAARRLGFANMPGAIAMATGGRILPQAGERIGIAIITGADGDPCSRRIVPLGLAPSGTFRISAETNAIQQG